MLDHAPLNVQKVILRERGLEAPGADALQKSKELSSEWDDTARCFLPFVDENSTWRYSRAAQSDDADQGWKLHISATILTATEVLKKVAPFLTSRKVLFKAPESLKLLFKLNSGLFYGYGQIGKFITIYPKDTDEAVRLARSLHKLTFGMKAPAVPFDLQYRPESCIYYRYGAFQLLELEIANVGSVAAIRDPSGNLVPDLRENPKPSWLTDPFQPRRQRKKSEQEETPLQTTYKVFAAMRQRGKGGVYQAIDLSTNPPQLCVVKEGRRHGEIGWDGSGGYDLIKYEAKVLTALQDANTDIPRFYSAFEAEGNFYLVTEFIEGWSLEKLMQPRKRRFSLQKTFRYASQIAQLLAQIHSAGWIWRDCKPANLIVTPSGSMRPLDFEGACKIGDSSVPGWRTLEFSAPEGSQASEKASKAEDIYSLGTVIYFLLTGKIYQPDSPETIQDLRRDVPEKARKIIEKILALPIQKKRPSAKSLAREFSKLTNFK